MQVVYLYNLLDKYVHVMYVRYVHVSVFVRKPINKLFIFPKNFRLSLLES
jgi:hypothetical protein